LLLLAAHPGAQGREPARETRWRAAGSEIACVAAISS
jgi:hypothetical protein